MSERALTWTLGVSLRQQTATTLPRRGRDWLAADFEDQSFPLGGFLRTTVLEQSPEEILQKMIGRNENWCGVIFVSV